MAIYLAIGFTVLLGLVLLSVVILSRTTVEEQRMAEVLSHERMDLQLATPVPSIGAGVVLRFAENIRSRSGVSVSPKLHARLTAAGMRDPGTADLFFAAQCLGPLVAVFAASFIPTNTFFWIFALGVVGYMAPDVWLSEMVRRRKEKIVRSLPDALDLLVICVDAGLGLDQALLRVGEELVHSHREIHEEFMRINLEQRAGRPRIDAWQDLVTRTRVTELAALVSMLTQADRFGTPILKTLTRFADDLRVKRRQKVEEAAAKTKIKIIFPLVFCIFPCLFIVLLAPALLSISATLSGK